jgi:hypothetical protein
VRGGVRLRVLLDVLEGRRIFGVVAHVGEQEDREVDLSLSGKDQKAGGLYASTVRNHLEVAGGARVDSAKRALCRARRFVSHATDCSSTVLPAA